MAENKPTVRADGKAKGKKYDSKATTPHPGFSLRHNGPNPRLGQPEIVLDETMLYEAAKTHASYDQLGKIFNCSGKSVWMKYKDLVEKARAERKKDLLSAQFATAINDRNPTMLIWLGKQYLGQRDVSRIEQTGADGKPIQTEAKVAVVAYIPDNGRDPAPNSPALRALGPGEVPPEAPIEQGVGLPNDDEGYPG